MDGAGPGVGIIPCREEVIEMNFIFFLLIGLVAGWIAGKLMRGNGLGLVGDLIVGVVGAVIGGLLFAFLGIAAIGLLGQLAMAVVGAVVLLGLARVFRRPAAQD